VIEDNGTVKHVGQYLCTEPGKNPNYEFVRNLKGELGGDDGTIFMYATHENSTLVALYEQFEADPNPPEDRQELMEFIRSMTYVKTEDKKDYRWQGPRAMVDLCALVKRFYYSPHTKGSNSLKFVLPAILNGSTFLQDKYSKPIYGGAEGIPSLNFPEPQAWIKKDGKEVKDPYKLLPRMFSDVSEHDYEAISDDEIRDGGAAMTAYAKLQYTSLSEIERTEIQNALLRYCELDTLAMVMLYEGWKALLD
jgi:hypothetical protein